MGDRGEIGVDTEHIFLGLGEDIPWSLELQWTGEGVFAVNFVLDAPMEKGFWLPEHPISPSSIPDTIKLLAEKLIRYFEGEKEDFSDIPTDLQNYTPFQRSVLEFVKHNIPYGNTITYKELAIYVKNSPAYSRAVGGVLRVNRIPIVIPCHRVVESSGDIGGYSWGKEIKRALLNLELYGRESLFEGR